jgi:hypothetical protein
LKAGVVRVSSILTPHLQLRKRFAEGKEGEEAKETERADDLD